MYPGGRFAKEAMATTTTSTSSSRSRKDTLLGQVIAGRYRLEARLGEGGMGVVYRARHVLIDRVVALKLIRPDLRGETHLRAWMLREARAANRVDHAHIVDIHDVGETEDGELYLVMEYLTGASLSSQIAKGPMPIPRAVDIIEQMTAALSRAHDLGVIHRDLKSDNIMLTHRGGRQDYVKILDFGLAALARDPRLAPKGAVFGTPEYMSPEQARGEDAIASSDLYALGILFYEMTTGQLPFRSSDRDTLLEMQRTGGTKNPSTLRQDLPEAAEQIILRLLQKKPDDRFRDGHHLQEELKAFQRSLPSTAWDRASQDAPQGPPPPPPAQSTGVVEWSKRAANFLRLVSRAYPNGRAPDNISAAADKMWDLAARASRLEGELASHAKKLEAIERRGRALRAEIGRKVEELSHEESSIARRAAEERDRARRIQRAIGGAQEAQQASAQRVQRVLQAGGDMATLQRIFEESGGLAGRVHALNEVLKEHDAKATRQEQQATSLRKQVTDLRAQLQRYGDALESDLTAGRERIATRVREALSYEKSFTDASATLVDHLKGKPECRELLEEVRKEMDKYHSLGSAPSKAPVRRRDSWVVKS